MQQGFGNRGGKWARGGPVLTEPSRVRIALQLLQQGPPTA